MKYFAPLFLILLAINQSLAQVGIGTTTPDNSSILDIRSTDKGVLLPSINLTSNTQQIGTSPNAEGLLIFNSGTTLVKGFYYWNGTEWRNLNNSTSIAPTITNLNCSAAVLNPSNYIMGTAYTGTLTIPYFGGNGGSYQGGSTITVNGLSATLNPGTLANGSGELVFSVTGTPTVSSPTTTTFAIQGSTGNNIAPFLASALHCNTVVGKENSATTTETAVLGPLTIVTDALGTGYELVGTTPDGRFSVRVVVDQNNAFANSDLQIRANGSPATIAWSALTTFQGGILGQGGNAFNLPNADTWYGNDGGNGDTAFSALTRSWGDADVYFNAPEFRRYSWTTTNGSDNKFYILNFQMGAPSPSQIANNTNCPSGTCNTVKAFIRLMQIEGN